MIGYELKGQGLEKVVVLHGWTAEHSCFEPVYPTFDMANFAFLLPDYRGCGLSKAQCGDYTIEEIGKDVVELVDHLGWDRFHLVGHSMGGMVVQWLAGNVTKRIKSAVAITPAPACGLPTLDPKLAEWLCNIEKDPVGLAKFYMECTGNRYNILWANALAAKSKSLWACEAYSKYAAAFIKTNFAASVAGVPVPLKVLVGEFDPAFTADVMKQTILKWFPNSELEILRNCGHIPMEEAPLSLGTSVQSFLSAHV